MISPQLGWEPSAITRWTPAFELRTWIEHASSSLATKRHYQVDLSNRMFVTGYYMYNIFVIAAKIAAVGPKQAIDPVSALKRKPDSWSENMMKELHGLYPFVPGFVTDLPLSVINWADDCRKLGLISYDEYSKLLNAVKETEGIY